ncbi:MAG TPA: hypothetical protein VD965_14125 [Burkholderiales bacterium]|nr:hypothetical protein [Burkholderiales bacterium]
MPGDQGLYRRALGNAVKLAGGEEELRKYLDVPETTLSAWLEGKQPIPESVFLKAVDLLDPAKKS